MNHTQLCEFTEEQLLNNFTGGRNTSNHRGEDEFFQMNYFLPLYSNSTLKALSATCSIITLVFGLPALAGIIWYGKNGNDRFR